MNDNLSLPQRISALKKEISELKDEVNRLSAVEQAVKVVLNGGYGATANVNFRYFVPTIAEGITATGQVAIRYITKKINEHLNKEIGSEGVDYCVMSDTDSVVAHTVLITDVGKIQIGDLYDQYTNESLELETNKNSVRKLTNPIKSASFDGNNIVFNNISYIMKHKVKKRMYRIKVRDTHVDITEDHGLIVMRDEQMISIKPIEVIKGDKIVRIVD